MAKTASGDAFDLKAAMGEIACTQMSLRRAARQLGNLYDQAVADSGLKATQVALLGNIQALNRPALQDLADAMALGLSSLTYALRPLVRDGLVALTPDPADRRTKHASLTAAGLDALKTGIALWREANQRTDAVLGADTALILRRLADQVASDDFLAAYSAAP